MQPGQIDEFWTEVVKQTADQVAPAPDIPFLDILNPSRDALALVPKRVAQRAQLLPLALDGRTLVCAGYDPIDAARVAQFQFEVRREVNLVKAHKADVLRGLDKAYGGEVCLEVDELLSAVTDQAVAQAKRKERSMDSARRPSRLRVISVTSGKGGVGKSTVVANLGVSLAQHNLRVALMDCDFGLSNLHVLLGARPKHTLADVVMGRVSFADALISGPAGVSLLGGASGVAELASMDYGQLVQAGIGFDQLANSFDMLLLDTAAGIHEGVISMLEVSEKVVFVITPDPTSIHDAYVTVKVLLKRKPTAAIAVLVNQAKDVSSAKLLFAKFQTFLSLYMDARAEYLGCVVRDEAVVRATRSRLPVAVAEPDSASSQGLDLVARKIAGLPEPALRRRTSWWPFARAA